MEMLKNDFLFACAVSITVVLLVKIVFEPLEKLYYSIKNRKKYNPGKTYRNYYQYKEADKNTKERYVVQKLLNDQEYQVYLFLKNECETKELLVLPKMRAEHFSNLIYTDAPVDFLLCDKEFNVIAGIELDINHKGEIVEQVFNIIKTPIFRITVHDEIYKEQLSNILDFVYKKYVIKTYVQ